MSISIEKKGLLALLLLVIAGLNACKKLDYDNNFVAFGDAYFQNKTALGQNLAIRNNGMAVDWPPTGLIHGVSGELKLEFYDKRTGNTIVERTAQLKGSDPERYILFQLEESDPIAFLDPNSQAGEASAPDGYMKIKIANLAKLAVPDEKIDMVFHSTVVSAVKFGPVDTIRNVGRNLETAPYLLVKRGVLNGRAQTRYKISFIKQDTKTELLSSTGALFFTTEFTTIDPAPKGVYTLYLTDALRTTAGGIKSGDKYYDVKINVLFKN